MNILPDEDRSFVRIQDQRLPECGWLLRLPEYGFGRRPLEGVAWKILEGGSALRFEWEPPEEIRDEAGVAYAGEIRAGEDEVEFSITRRNLSSVPWENDQRSLFCLMSRDATPFHDIDGVRTYALKDGIFQSVCQLVNSRFAEHRMCSFPVRSDPAGPREDATERLMAKISRDGKWGLAMATDIGGHVSCNQQPRVSCIHSNPNWGEVPPGGEAGARGKVYLVPAPAEDLISRYTADFAC